MTRRARSGTRRGGWLRPLLDPPRGLGAYMTVFAIESFMDELAGPPAPTRWRSGCAAWRTPVPGPRRQWRDRQPVWRAQSDRGRHHPVGQLDLCARASRNETRVLSRDWGTYPILRFADLPDSVEVHLIDRPGQRFLGTGECAQGPTATIGNAIADATGVRLRTLPFRARRVKQAVDV